MAARVLLISIACTVGLITGKTIGLELGVVEGGEGEVVGVKNHALQLPCRPTYEASVSWTHDGQFIHNNSRRFIAENGSLVITKVVHKKKGESDGGIYQCIVSNSNGAIISSPVKVTIAALAHDFTENPANISMTEGDLLRLTCSIDSSPPAKIVWLRGDEPLPHNKRYTAIDSGVLYIANMKIEDKGQYRCQASNGYIKKIRLSSVAEVTVSRPSGSLPQSIKFLSSAPPNTLTLPAGRKGLIICAVSGIPRPNVKWIRTQPDGSNSTVQTTTNGLNIIQINKVTSNYSGVYICVASQNFKDRVTSIQKVVVVEVETPPQIIEKPKSQMYPAAKTVRIECEAKGYPQPQVTWYKDGNLLDINGRIKQRAKELIIGGVVTQDTGIYQCFATSPTGVAWGAGRIVVNKSTNQPAPPTKLSCSTLSPTQVNLSWVQEIQSDFKAFSVHYSPTDGGDELKEVTQNQTFIINKLQPYTNYTFYVRSYNGRAASEHSKSVICKTGEAVPTGGPTIFVNVTGPHCLLVSWTPPEVSLARGSITHYKVQWKRVNQSSTNFDLVPGHIRQYRISGIYGGQDYLVRVIGATSLGWPELTDEQAPWVKVTTPKTDNNSIPPPVIQLTPVNTSTIHVEWSFPGGRHIEGFKISYRELYKSETTQIIVPKNASDFYIVNLESATWYEVSVNAFSNNEQGESCVENVLTRESVFFTSSLPVPTSLEATSITPHSINVSWSVLNHQQHATNITHFTVLYNLLYGPTQNFTGQTVKTSNMSIEIVGLIPNTMYEFSVRAHGINNQVSAVSSKVECKTLAEVLDIVENVKLKALNKTSVQVTWNGVKSATHFIVFYTIDGTANLNLWHKETVYKNQTTIQLKDLKMNLEYTLRVRGMSGSGPGPLSDPVVFTLHLDENNKVSLTKPLKVTSHSDQYLGIIVGCLISALCIIICTASLLYKRRCAKLQGQVSSNGNGQCSNEHEMQSLTQLDSKGGFQNGQLNGLKLQLISNGGLPNGIIQDKGVRITENPQRGQAECGSSRTTDEGDSLLSGPDPEIEAEDTQLTILGNSTLSKELPADDGFYETSQPLW